jgi:hypothetical protein
LTLLKSETLRLAVAAGEFSRSAARVVAVERRPLSEVLKAYSPQQSAKNPVLYVG